VLSRFSQKSATQLLPDVPTLKEIGFHVVSGSSRGYSAPKGIPAIAKEKLLSAFVEMAKNPDFVKAAANMALPLDIKIGDDYGKYLQEQEEIFKAVWDEVKDQYRTK